MGAGLVQCVWRRGRFVRSPVRCFGRLLARRLLGIVITLLSGTPHRCRSVSLSRCPWESIRGNQGSSQSVSVHNQSQFTASLSSASLSQCPLESIGGNQGSSEAIRAHQRQSSQLAFQSGLIRGHHLTLLFNQGSSEAIISPCFSIRAHQRQSSHLALHRLIVFALGRRD